MILLLIGLDMLRARIPNQRADPQPKRCRGEAAEGAGKEDAGIESDGRTYVGRSRRDLHRNGSHRRQARLWYAIPVFLAIAAVSVVSCWILAGTDRVRQYLGETGIRVLTRLMGLMLTAIAVQFMLNGLEDVGLVKAVQ